MSMYPLFRTSYVSSSSSPSFSWSSFRNKLRQQRQQRRYVSSHTSVFGENDRVLLRHVALPDKTYLSQPLEPGKSLNSHFGFISHSDIIGRRTRDVVATNKGTEFRLTWPTLDEYVTRVRRLVTPVYPLDAATIVSLLDIHVDAGSSSGGTTAPPPPLEIFEAGTGHGSLTLALAKAVHPGNSHLPPLHESNNNNAPLDPEGSEWKTRRGAVIHTLDISEKHSLHARSVIRGFRRGMYSPSVEFYVGDPTKWMLAEIERRTGAPESPRLDVPEAAEPEAEAAEAEKKSAATEYGGFLYSVLLDLPGPQAHLRAASRALISDGIIGVFCPSITQIGVCVGAIKRDPTLQLVLDRAIEFPGGAGVGAGLRTWDVRYARVRSRAVAAGAGAGERRRLSVLDAENRYPERPGAAAEPGDEKDYEMVCRPTSFERSVGGGFFAIFRRKARGGEGAGSAKNAQPAVPVVEDPGSAKRSVEPVVSAEPAVPVEPMGDSREQGKEEKKAATRGSDNLMQWLAGLLRTK